MPPPNDHGTDWDSVELPESDEDVERILKFPHVNSCNFCHVCVPQSVVASHPRAAEAAASLSNIFDHGDLIEDAVHSSVVAQPLGRRLLSRHDAEDLSNGSMGSPKD
eukprot:gene18770-25304_t